MKKILFIVLSFLCVSAFGQTRNNNPNVFNVLNFGAYGDGKVVYDCQTIINSTTVQSATAAFLPTDVGKIIHIDSAGPSYTRITDTIATYVNPTTVYIKHNASFSSTNQMMDYGHDDCREIQAALNAAKAAGGGVVFFPNPNSWGGQFYDLASPYVTSVDGINPNCQLYIPLDSNLSTNGGTTIVMQGEVPPYFPEGGAISITTKQTWKGSVLYSTVTSGSGSPAIIGSSYYNDGYSNINLATGVFRNLTIRAYNGCSTHPVQGNRSGIDRTYLSKSDCRDLMIDNSCAPYYTSAPNSTTGLKGQSIYNFSQNTGDRVFIVGYQTGITLGEHEHWGYLTINTVLYGVTPLYGVAGCDINTLQIEAFRYGIYIPSGSQSNNVNIINYYPEHDIYPTWAAYVEDVYVDASVGRTVNIYRAQIGGSPGSLTANDYTKMKCNVISTASGSQQSIDLDHSLQTVSDASTVTADLFLGRQIAWTIGGNHILAISDAAAGDKFKIIVTENATGGYAITYPIGSKVVGVINPTANAVSIIDGFYDGTTYYFNVWGAGVLTQSTLTDASTISWPISGNTSVAVVHLNALAANSNRQISITGSPTPTLAWLKVFHDSAGTTISLPGRYSFNFQWGTNINDVTLLKGLYDGTEWGWESTIMPDNTDSSVKAYVSAVIAAGGTVSTVQKGYINSFVTALKSQGVYTKIYAMYFPVWGSATADKYNIINTSLYTLTWSGSWTHASSGVTPDGSTAYANTGFNPSTNATQNSIGMGGYVQIPDPTYVYIMGNTNGTVYNLLSSTGAYIGADVNAAPGDNLSVLSSSTRLVYSIRASSSSFTAYRDGAVPSGFPQTSTSLSPYNGNLYIGALNSSGSAAFFGKVKCSFYIITDGTLNATDAANLAFAVQTLHTNFGIQQ